MTEACEILLVEDNLHDAEMTARALDAYDLAKLIYHVKDGEEALDYLFGRGLYAYRNARRVPRFVLLDINLPRVSGLEVLRQIKANDRTKRIPVVIFTASREEQDRIESHHLGVNSYITKPLDAEQFAKTISEAGLYWMRFNPSPASEQGTSSKWM